MTTEYVIQSEFFATHLKHTEMAQNFVTIANRLPNGKSNIWLSFVQPFVLFLYGNPNNYYEFNSLYFANDLIESTVLTSIWVSKQFLCPNV